MEIVRNVSFIMAVIVLILTIHLPRRKSVHVDDVYTMEDRALMSIKNRFTGAKDYLGHWNSTATNHCLWPEIRCNKSNFVVGIYFTKNYSGLEGQLVDLTEGLANLPHLQYLTISNTKISGIIPSDLGNLTGLKGLDFSSNNLTGRIPDSLGNLLNLEYLFLSRNSLSGTIPSSLSNLMNLTSLGLSENSFTGTIPLELGNLTNLVYMDLSNNRFTGTIPSTLGILKNLPYLSLSNNMLSGEIPTTLTHISSLEYLNLTNNDIGGNVPCNGSFVKFGPNSFKDNPRLNISCKRGFANLSCTTDPNCAVFRLFNQNDA